MSFHDLAKLQSSKQVLNGTYSLLFHARYIITENGISSNEIMPRSLTIRDRGNLRTTEGSFQSFQMYFTFLCLGSIPLLSV